jgi:hypothetical protein
MGGMRNRAKVMGIRDPNAAGASSELRFRSAMLQFWRQNIGTMLVLTLAAPVMVAVALIVQVNAVALYALIFGAGFCSATAMCCWMIVPHRIQHFRTGAEGESQTARELDRLTHGGWRPVHDRALDRCNVDHIQIGPGGVFVIETKNWKGRIGVNERGVTQDGTVRDSVAPSARRAALQINQRIAANGVKPGWVNAVVVFWGDFPQGMVEQDKVTYLAGEKLAEWLRAQPARLNGIEIDKIASVIATMRPGVELSLAS